MSMAAGDPMAIAERVIEENRYLTLGTADEQGNPWVSPLWYATNTATGSFCGSPPPTQGTRRTSWPVVESRS